jgi:hypothetical protein
MEEVLERGNLKEALKRVREARAGVSAWGSAPGEARALLLEARLLGRRASRGLLIRSASLAVRHRDDLTGWLRDEVEWIGPLLAPLLDRDGVEALLVDLGTGATDALVGAERVPDALIAIPRSASPEMRGSPPIAAMVEEREAAVRSAAASALAPSASRSTSSRCDCSDASRSVQWSAQVRRVGLRKARPWSAPPLAVGRAARRASDRVALAGSRRARPEQPQDG